MRRGMILSACLVRNLVLAAAVQAQLETSIELPGDVSVTDNEASILIVRLGDTNAACSVDFLTLTKGTALPGIDYKPVAARISFAPGQRTASVSIPLLDDGLVDLTPGKWLEAVLTNASNRMEIGLPEDRSVGRTVRITIPDLEIPALLDVTRDPKENPLILFARVRLLTNGWVDPSFRPPFSAGFTHLTEAADGTLWAARDAWVSRLSRDGLPLANYRIPVAQIVQKLCYIRAYPQA